MTTKTAPDTPTFVVVGHTVQLRQLSGDTITLLQGSTVPPNIDPEHITHCITMNVLAVA